MKRLLIASLVIAVPIAVFAETDQGATANTTNTNTTNSTIERPFNPQRNRTANHSKRYWNNTTNSNSDATTAEPRTGRELDQLHNFKPSSPAEAFSYHQRLLSERIEFIQDNEHIPEERKATLVQKFTEELTWMQDKHAALEAATTPEEKQAIRQEIIEHVHSAQAERRQNLAETVTLPEQSPVDLANRISERFHGMSEQLQQHETDTTELDAAIANYDAAVADLATGYEAVRAEKTVEGIQTLRDQIKTVREAAADVRNIVQSLVK
jgi:hypothetical protein